MKPLLVLVVLGMLIACDPPSNTPVAGPADTASQPPKSISTKNRNVLDWQGTYSGTLPCADCEGILTTLTLTNDNNYALTTTYLGKDEKMSTDTGRFTWNEGANTIMLEGLSNRPRIYKVSENRLTQMDMSGKPVTSNLASQYVLAKINNDISNKYWKLVELMGKPVAWSGDNQKREPHFILHPSDSKVSGSGGCNNFFGMYQVSANNRIRFSTIGSTLMACNDGMKTETMFLQTFRNADSYVVNDDSLQLNKARMAPLARFVAVYLQ